MKQLNEKVAIVTGAGQGIGKGIALCLAKRGVKIVCVGRRPEPIEETAQEIRALGGEGFAMTCNTAERERVKEVVQKTVEAYGTVDVMINNAQSLPGSSPVEETTYDQMYTCLLYTSPSACAARKMFSKAQALSSLPQRLSRSFEGMMSTSGR